MRGCASIGMMLGWYGGVNGIRQAIVAVATGLTVLAMSTASVPKSSAATSAQVGNIRVHHVLWHDEFDGPAGNAPDPTKWTPETGGGGWGNHELETYTDLPENAALDGAGHAVITARAEQYASYDGITRSFTSARLVTDLLFNFRYGLMQARIQVPAGRGLLPAFWALEQWPPAGRDAGEIDAMEVVGSAPARLHGTLHGGRGWPPGGAGGTKLAPAPLSAGFHVYSAYWTPRTIRFLLDGKAYKTLTPADLRRGAAWPFRHPFYLLLDIAVGGDWPGSPDASTVFPASMTVDWVRVWQ